MLVVLLIIIPLLGGLLTLFAKQKMPFILSLFASLLTVCISIYSYMQFGLQQYESLIYNTSWIAKLGARFHIGIDNGLPMLMVLLTAIAFPLIILLTQDKHTDRPATFYGLLLLAEAGLMGVFLSKDALLFYVFWEIALIPVYFLSALFGGEHRIKVSFKFFVYTFVGSLLMLVALLYIYNKLPIRSFQWDSLISTSASLSGTEQNWLFWMMFIAFAIKMPIFPFHTWQPDTYEQSNTPTTMVLSALMVKMGLFAVIRWLLPLLPDASMYFKHIVMMLSIVGIVYASCLALIQKDIKRLLAYSSIAHIGLMCAAIFSHEILGLQGAVIQMFNHGITILAMWALVYIIEHRIGTRNLNDMGGIAQVAPAFTIALVIISLANIALPLTNGFVGEFMMFNAIFDMPTSYHWTFTIVAGLGIILSAVYTLKMVQHIAFGETNALTQTFTDLTITEKVVLYTLIAMILVFGFYPNALLDLVRIGS
ncbi:MAG: NADH-quinone oxidoreductase subunit M [Chitinophagaceae bacterium]